jgi:RNA polymerase sigma-70 factor (ECF subfamily)
MQPQPELQLIADGKQGNTAALAELFGRHYPSSLRIARGILRSEDDSQDAVQVAYFSAFQHLDSFRGEACFKTWITSIVVNSCRMQLRKPGRRLTWVQLDDLPGGRGADMLACSAPTPEKVTWCGEIGSALNDAVSRLPQQLREVYLLYSHSGLSLKEVAAQLGLTVPATKTRLYRARAGVRSHLRPLCSGVSAHRTAGLR